nr:MAG TPA: hypothetical protein [Caudoviricetes sp.]
MRYKDEVKGASDLNMINHFIGEIEPTDTISIRRDVAEMLLVYVDEALAARSKQDDEHEIADMLSRKLPEMPKVQKQIVQAIDTCGVSLDMIEINMLSDLVQEQLERTELDKNFGKQYVFDLMSLNHKLQVEHMKRR